MSETRQITLSTNNGGTVTYNIIDHNSGEGLGLNDVESVIRNVHKTDTYNNRIADGLANADGGEAVLDVHIDDPDRTQTQAWYRNGEDGINISTDDFLEFKTYAEKNTGESVQKDVDSAFVHETKHILDNRTDEDMSHLADTEDRARDVTNEFRRELGLAERDAHGRASEVTSDLNGDGVVDVKDQNVADDAAEKASEDARVADDRTKTVYNKDVDQDNAENEANVVPDERYDDPDSRGEIPTTPLYNFDDWLSEIKARFDWTMDYLKGTGSSGGHKKKKAESMETEDPLGDINDAIDDAVGGDYEDLQDLVDDDGDPEGAKGRSDELPLWLKDALLGLGIGSVASTSNSPLVIDVDGSGTIDLVSVEDSTIHFDFWQDGFAERTGWVAAHDGFLVHDLDADGLIEGVAEMFGSSYPLGYVTREWTVNEENGFAKLAVHDGNADGVVDVNDAAFASLQVWQDLNQDGVSQADELFSLTDIGIESIDVSNYQLDSWNGVNGGGWGRSIEGNTITHTGTVNLIGGGTSEVVDAWFSNDLQNAVYAQNYDLDVRTLFVPTLRGYGVLPDLFVSMSADEALLDSVTDFFIGRDFVALFAEYEAVRAEVKDILLAWSGSTDQTENYYHGLFGTIPEYDFLRKLTGIDSPYLGTWFDGTADLPDISAGMDAVLAAWNNVLDAYAARLVFQSGGLELFEHAYYNLDTDDFSGDLALNQDAVNILETQAAASPDLVGFWRFAASYIDDVKGVDQLTAADVTMLDDAVDASSSGIYAWSDIVSLLSDNVFEGASTNDVLSGTEFDDVMSGYAGDDVFDGGEGNDVLDGDYGSDVYHYSAGHDTIVERADASDTNVIVFDQGVEVEDVTLHWARKDAWPTDHFFIEIEGRGTILIDSQRVNGIGKNSVIQEVHFFDGTVKNLLDMDVTFHGLLEDDGQWEITQYSALSTITQKTYDGDDTLFSSHDGTTIFDAGAGNDTITAGDADDIYILSYGVDTITDYGGNDVIKLPEGVVAADVQLVRAEVGGVNSAYDDAVIIVEGYGEVRLLDQFNYAPSTGRPIETLEFFDGSTIDLTQHVYTVLGTSGDDVFSGVPSQWPNKDDVYLFGEGNDVIRDPEGINALIFGAGVTLNDIRIEKHDAGSLSYNKDALVISDGLGNSVRFEQYFENQFYKVDYLEFADGSTYQISEFEVDSHGTSGDDNMDGIQSGDLSQDDVMYGYDGNDALYGQDGNDILFGGLGADYLDGGAGNDTADYSMGSAVVADLQNNSFSGGEAEGDYLYAVENLTGSDSSAGADRDYLYGNAQDNVLKGMAGNDFLEGGAGTDTLDGGAGWDYARYTRSDAGVNINLETGVHTGGHAAGDTLISIEAIVGSDHDDTFIGASSNDYFKGGAGSDIINPGLGYDKSYGDAGDDTFIYTGGSEYIYETTGHDRVEFDAVWSPEDLVIDGNTFIFGSTSNQITFDNVSKYEVFKFDGHADMSLAQLQAYLAAQGVTYTGDANDNTFTGTSATETFDGLGGIDTVDYSASTVGNKVDLQAGAGTEGDAAGDEYLSIENIIGSDASSKRDWIWGDAQDNAISGMAGDDILEGGAGADTIDGGAGWDYSRYTRSDAAVNINLETGVNTGGHAEGDILSNIEAIVGSSYGDTIRGGNSNDYLKGENGDDLLIGGNGIDQLYGGNGADTFLFESATAFTHVDQLRDFDLSEGDILNIADLLSGYDAVTDMITDFVQITDNGTNSSVAVDADGGADNFVTIATLYGATGLTDEEALETSGNLVTV